MESKKELGKKIASFIVMSVAVAVPAVAASDDVNVNYDLIADAGTQIHIDAPVCRYAGPEYFGYNIKPNTVKPSLPDVKDVAQYAQLNNTQVNEAATMKNVDSVTILNKTNSNGNFVNSQYGSVKVIEPSAHYVFK